MFDARARRTAREGACAPRDQSRSGLRSGLGPLWAVSSGLAGVGSVHGPVWAGLGSAVFGAKWEKIRFGAVWAGLPIAEFGLGIADLDAAGGWTRPTSIRYCCG
jgi:hypothetical protein